MAGGTKLALRQAYPDWPEAQLRNYMRQIWAFVHGMHPGDWAVVPYKGRPALNVAEVVGPYVFDPAAPDPYYHYREVKWISKDIPRSNFGRDLLY
jgi:restriction system protein